MAYTYQPYPKVLYPHQTLTKVRVVVKDHIEEARHTGVEMLPDGTPAPDDWGDDPETNSGNGETNQGEGETLATVSETVPGKPHKRGTRKAAQAE